MSEEFIKTMIAASFLVPAVVSILAAIRWKWRQHRRDTKHI